MSDKRGGEPKRKVSDTAKRRSILVFTEGKKTEPIYLIHWSRAYRERIIVTIDDFHGAPLSLVQEAAARRAVDLKTARRGRGDAYSEYWCMFDIDEHPNVARAVELAASSGVSVCVTNPCVELWFLLHFQDQNAAIHRHDAQRKASEYLSCGKTPTSAALAALASQYEDARHRAQTLDRKHELDGSPQRSNPSSEVWRLIETIRQTNGLCRGQDSKSDASPIPSLDRNSCNFAHRLRRELVKLVKEPTEAVQTPAMPFRPRIVLTAAGQHQLF